MATTPNRKPRGDSRLKTLPPERQRAIFEKMQTCTLAEAVKWLRDDGFETSDGALSEFGSWYGLNQRFAAAEDFSQQFVDLLKQSNFGLTAEQLLEAGNQVFLLKAAKDNDAKLFIKFGELFLNTKQSKQKDVQVQLTKEKGGREERHLRLLEAKAAKADELKSDLEKRKTEGGLTAETRELIERSLKMLS